MTQIENSSLLNQLTAFASEVCRASAAVTAEKLIAAAFEMMDRPEAESELSEFRAFLSAHVANLSEAKQKLKQAASMQTFSIEAEMYYQEKKLLARKTAEKQGEKLLSADRLLMSILNDPSEVILDCLSLESRQEEPAPEAEPPKQDALSTEARLAAMLKLRTFLSGAAQAAAPEGAEPEVPETKRTAAEMDAPAQEQDPEAAPNVGTLVDAVKQLRSKLTEKIFGQDHAISVLVNGYFQGELSALTDRHRVRPRATFLFAGSSGVGKTFLAETAGEVLSLPFKRFDMSEYSSNEAVTSLCGSDSVYKGSQSGILTGFVKKHPRCILLFDEIEKAHRSAIHLFLQILDGGRLTDTNTRKEVSFKDAIVIFTTNAGKSLYEDSETDDMSGLSRKVILNALSRETNPATGEQFFPEPICSRFASGNVVMFNRMSAHHLLGIAKSVALQQAADLKACNGLKIEIDEDVYTALLLSEGGAADARMVRGRAATFFHEELFELFRLLDSDGENSPVDHIETIRFRLTQDKMSSETRTLFAPSGDSCALLFCSDEAADWCSENRGSCRMLRARDREEGMELLRKENVQFVLADLSYRREENTAAFINAEDLASEARAFLREIREKRPELPVYLLTGVDEAYNLEERVSFHRFGVQGILEYGGDPEAFAARIDEICGILHQQGNISTLQKSNKLLRFETGQTISDDGKTAEIVLFDFSLHTAVDGSDKKNVLSAVSRPDVHFAEVIGAEDAKKELQYFVDYLKNPKEYAGTDVSAPKGVLLYGPPGTGKTLLAKAMATESDVTFIAAEGNQFLKKYVGEGPEAVHSLFRTARRYAPSILFVDEIDAIAKPRTGSEQSEAREEILTAFLTEMDGFRVDPAHPVFVLAATNFNVEPGSGTSLDQALMRRFDRRICVDLPDKDARIRYLRMQFDKKRIFAVSDEMIENIAIRSTGMSLAALSSVLELSMRTMIRDKQKQVTDKIFEDAFETFHSGDEKKWDPAELERTARHEAGHALLSWLSGDKPSYLTIVARGSHGGYMQRGDSEQKGTYTRTELLDRIRTSLGGRGAEIVYYGETDGVSSGASGDLAAATSLAKRIICSYGMDSAFGLAVIEPDEANTPEVRQRVNQILRQEMDAAVRILKEHRPALDQLVDALLKSNRLTGTEIDDLLSKSITH